MDTKAKILLADDSSFMRKVLKDILAGMGFTSFIEAENGKEVVEKVASEKPDLITMDIIMPEMDGMEALKKLKSSGSTVKVIVVSAVGQEDMIKEAKALGIAGYLVKPFDKDQVVAAVKQALG